MKDEITREERVTNLKGLGSSRKRVEDARFTQGKEIGRASCRERV